MMFEIAGGIIIAVVVMVLAVALWPLTLFAIGCGIVFLACLVDPAIGLVVGFLLVLITCLVAR